MSEPLKIEAGDELLEYIRARGGVLSIGDFYFVRG